MYWSTEDLHQTPCQDEITVMTEHERMFTAKGIPIKAAKARLLPRPE